MTRGAATALVGALLVLSACGGGGPERASTPSPSVTTVSPSPSETPNPAATCTPHGTKLSIVAKGIHFDTDCLAAPADTAFTIRFSNESTISAHNVSIEAADGERAFVGDTIDMGATTYHVPALATGSYEFVCTLHPSVMRGAFVVA